MEVKLNLSNNEYKELVSFCNLNDLLVSEVVKKSFMTGFNIERYGLLNTGDRIIEKEVIKEVEKKVEIPVEVIKEVIKIEYVEVEKPVEVIKEIEKPIEVIREVPVERVVIKEVIKEIPIEKVIHVTDHQELNEKIFQKEEQFNQERQKFSTKTTEMENIFQEEKNKLLLKIQQLESKEPEVVEIVKEIVVEKQVASDLQPKLEALQNTVQKLKQDNIEKDKKIKEYEKTIQEIQKFQQDKKAMFLKGSNLDDNLYK